MAVRNWQLAMPTPECYWINRVLFDVHHKDGHLQRYLDNPVDYMKDISLPTEVKHLIRDNAIGQLYLAGANPYLLRAHALGVRMPEDAFLRSLRAVGSEASHG
ncbi:subunit of meta cleavage enzyme [Pseudorhodoferax sp. Leaf265]|uniref:subunit of meta cleavage enzyme n=1 Tax=Pseudorhodoferax sp. Leaf265 TaxID=1736315 RepID=UPI0006F576E8|nr:subunit of meta cleavage enzyme [Pseudorhodoferax sp. Leaf265]KQP04228.1 subunit of meta cleavage enzyme [Pseudorhodoferax sp. Leaf265]